MMALRRLWVGFSISVLMTAHAAAEPPSRAQSPSAAAQPKPAQAVIKDAASPRALSADELRAQRRVAWRALMRNLHSPAELPAVVRQELRTHSWRMARLLRIRALALVAHDQALVTRADQLMLREQTRHREQLVRAWPAAPRKKRAALAAAVHEDDDDDREREPEEIEDLEARP